MAERDTAKDSGITAIVYRVDIDNMPADNHDPNKIIREGIVEKLKEHGWIDANGYALKRFKTVKECHLGEKNYIQWTSTLVQDEREQ